ncbi:MAG TPA: VOC family protein [Candidatus Binataceae bacterium]|nr:VOC family protein [Candidatus Binataceae bacterium]
MAKIKRLDRLDVGTADIDDAAAVYRRNFGLAVKVASGGSSASVNIGAAEISLIPMGPQSEGEGMSGLWLEAEDVDAVSAALSQSGCGFKPIRLEGTRRILEVEPKSANQVPLFIFDRKG